MPLTNSTAATASLQGLGHFTSSCAPERGYYINPVTAIRSPEAAVDALLNAEAEAGRAIAALKRSITVVKPRAIGMGKVLPPTGPPTSRTPSESGEVVMPLLVEMEEGESSIR